MGITKYPRGPSLRGSFWRLRLPTFAILSVSTSAVKYFSSSVESGLFLTRVQSQARDPSGFLLSNPVSHYEAIDTGNNVMVTTWFNPSPRINRGNITTNFRVAYIPCLFDLFLARSDQIFFSAFTESSTRIFFASTSRQHMYLPQYPRPSSSVVSPPHLTILQPPLLYFREECPKNTSLDLLPSMLDRSLGCQLHDLEETSTKYIYISRLRRHHTRRNSHVFVYVSTEESDC